MCDFSLQSVRSRLAKVGDKLVTRDFGTGTRGFADASDLGTAVCLVPGSELAFAGEVVCLPAGLLGWKTKTINHRTAIFRQVNKDKPAAHHDAIEFPDGKIVLLTLLSEGRRLVFCSCLRNLRPRSRRASKSGLVLSGELNTKVPKARPSYRSNRRPRSTSVERVAIGAQCAGR
jgi:hypothetical protein